MATIDAKTNVYEISRATPSSLVNIQDMITEAVNKYMQENGSYFIGSKGIPGTAGGPGTPGKDGNIGKPGLNGKNLEVGCTVVCYENSGAENSWYTLLEGVRAEWGQAIAAESSALHEAYADADEAYAEYTSNTYATYGDVTAEAQSVLGAYTNSVEAYAYQTTILQATYDGVTASIEEGAKVWAGDIQENKGFSDVLIAKISIK